MVITKIIGMIIRKEVKNIIFVSVDKSPHCVQLHYIVTELKKIPDIDNIKIKNYVATENGLEDIPFEVIAVSKNLSKLKKMKNSIS